VDTRNDDSTGHWTTVIVDVSSDEVDEASGALWSGGVDGVEERAGVEPGRIELLGGVPAGRIDPVLAELGDRWPVRVQSVRSDEGLDAWREFARPWRAGARTVVVPSWLDVPEWAGPDDLVLRIDPGHTFGSGSHPTTRMCLAELESLVTPGSSVADIGCGSGVLAVAAARLGAAAVVAIDLDPAAIEATRSNAERNEVEGLIDASVNADALLEAGAHDVIVANIGAATLRTLAPAIVGALGADGVLILSGVLDEQVDEVMNVFVELGFVLAATAAEDEWRALLLRRG
jgi:ribosomal protein L11 methyltransferase